MVHNYRGGRLFWIEHEFIGEFDVDTFRLQKLEKLCLVGNIGAGGVAKTESRSAIPLVEKLGKLRCVVPGYPEFLTDAFMPHLGKGLG